MKFTVRVAVLLAVLEASTGLADSSTSSTIAEPKRPNIVFFIVDDLGQRDLGCYGSQFYDTPNIDGLAKAGTMLTQAYATCPVCSPTRASLLTGRYPQRTGITDYIGAAQPEKWKRNTKHLPAAYSTELDLKEVTLAEVLKSSGYATFFGGKWHLGDEGHFPEDQGFDVNKGGHSAGGPYGGKKYFSPYGNPRLSDGPSGEHLPDRLASEAAQFIDKHRSEPFLVYLPFYSVHTPLIARDDLKAKYEARRTTLTTTDQFGTEPPRKVRLTQDHAVYAGMVEAMDQAVGKVLAKLTELGLDDNTLVIFTSDNGGLSTSEGSPTSNAPLRAGKGWLYEGGIRTAGILRWPGVIPAGTTNNTLVMSADYFATILDASSVPMPSEVRIDGRSILPALKSKSHDGSRALCWHYPHYGNQGGAPGAAIREGDWKLIEWFESDQIELFNLASDPSETKNLATAEVERVHTLRSALHTWQNDVDAIRSTPNPNYDASKADGRQ